MRRLENEVALLKENVKRLEPEILLQSRNQAMQRTIETMKKAADSGAIVLLRGESGTGKSVFARTIHQWSSRAAKPMMVVSCPAVPSDLLKANSSGMRKSPLQGPLRRIPDA